MAYELKDNSGSLFKNDKRTTDNHPHARGQAKIDGVLYWVSAWTKTTKDGDKFQSLSFTRQEERESRQPAGGGGPVDDDDLPFAPEWRG